MRKRKVALPVLVVAVLAAPLIVLVASPALAASWVVPVSAEIWQGFKPGHQGVDLGAARGTPIHAAYTGTVEVVECNAHSNGEPYSCDVDGSPSVLGCGWYVDISHEGDITTRYCHMPVRPSVNVGDRVYPGTVIGYVGDSGHSSAPHLHFETHVNGEPVDPIPFMESRGAPLGAPAGSGGATAETTSPVPTTSDISPRYQPVYTGARYPVTTFASAPGYTPAGSWSGALRPGHNYVLCQGLGGTWNGANGTHNNLWLWTLLDSPRGAYGWVSAYFLTNYGNDEAYADPTPQDPRPAIEWCLGDETTSALVEGFAGMAEGAAALAQGFREMAEQLDSRASPTATPGLATATPPPATPGLATPTPPPATPPSELGSLIRQSEAATSATSPRTTTEQTPSPIRTAPAGR